MGRYVKVKAVQRGKEIMGKWRLRPWVKGSIVLLAAAGIFTLTHLNLSEEEEIAAVPSPSETPLPSAEPEVYTADIFMTGDCLIHGAVYADARQADGSYDFHPMLENLKTWTDDYDLCYYNQESILGGTKLGLSSYPMFNSPQEVGDAMTDNGFNLVSLANNHSLDRGVSGIESSMKYWNSKEQVVHAGTNLSEEERDSIPVYEVNGISYCFLSWTYGCNGLYPPSDMPYLVNIYTDHEEELLEQVRQADQKADLVIVAMHWGVEYTLEPVQEVKDLAQQLADAGADLIIGNHPHVIEPIEYFGDTLCFYSFGNLIAAQLDTEDRIGMIGAVTVTKTVQPDGETEISLSDARADLAFICYDSNIRNFKVVLMRDLDDSQLADHEAIYDKYQKVLTQYDGRIQIGMK